MNVSEMRQHPDKFPNLTQTGRRNQSQAVKHGGGNKRQNSQSSPQKSSANKSDTDLKKDTDTEADVSKDGAEQTAKAAGGAEEGADNKEDEQKKDKSASVNKPKVAAAAGSQGNKRPAPGSGGRGAPPNKMARGGQMNFRGGGRISYHLYFSSHVSTLAPV